VVELALVSKLSHVVCSVPLLLQALPFHDDEAPVHAFTPVSVTVPSRW
jgi:hypothetical protein